MGKQFHISDIVSITTGRLVSTRHIDGVYDILNYMTGDNLFTHQLPRASRECGPILLEQHPQLKEVNGDECNTENWREWLQKIVKQYGEYLTVEPLDKSEHAVIDPLTELITMMAK